MNNGKFNWVLSRIREILDCIKFHASILARGIARVLYGTLVAGLFVMAALGFILVTRDNGYVAVFDFVAASATLAVALGNVYLIGCKRGAKK